MYNSPLKFNRNVYPLKPSEYNNNCVKVENHPKLIQKVLEERNTSTDETLIFNQLFNICYQENRGARMYTFGGVIRNNDFNIDELNLNDFEFISQNDEIYKREIANLTRKEIDLIDCHLIKNEDELLKKNIITEQELKSTKKYINTCLTSLM